jgi:hypothetical protein
MLLAGNVFYNLPPVVTETFGLSGIVVETVVLIK